MKFFGMKKLANAGLLFLLTSPCLAATITSPLPDIGEPVFVNRPGAAELAIDGSGLYSASSVRILKIKLEDSGSELSGLTFQNATTTNRGPLWVVGATTIRDCVFQDNRSEMGGTIRAARDLIVERYVFRRNTALEFGGGAVALRDADRTLIVRDSLFEDNETLGRDGRALSVMGKVTPPAFRAVRFTPIKRPTMAVPSASAVPA